MPTVGRLWVLILKPYIHSRLRDIILTYRRFLIIASVLLCGALSVWAVLRAGNWTRAREIKDLADDAFCVVKLKEGDAIASGSFTTSQTIEQFRVGVFPEANGEHLRLFFDGGNRFSYRGAITRPGRFGVGRNVPPGTYTVTLRQVAGTHGGMVVITDKGPPLSAGITAWQIISRTYLGALAICGIWAFIARRSSNLRQHALATLVFQYALLGFLVVFFFLLCHEGGHALVEIFFGRYDFARSDFWGIHGHPHSGGTTGPALTPRQHGLITGGAVILPTLVAWALFLFWRSFIRGRRRPIVRLYFSGTIGFLLFLDIIMFGGCLLGVITESHFDGLVIAMPGPQWFIKTTLWCVLLVSILIYWQVVPEIIRIMKAHYLELRGLRQSHDPNETGHGPTSQPTARADR